ncbi:MAG TPA: hypothetical protein VN893_08470 [Bryobacteraceae bacterium]|jgi:hypothetical protein|nr:hypothetical protein [Bryobacteraceae bacterium]
MSSSSADPNTRTLADAMHELIDRPLASVEFVRDYIQLHFDGPTLTAYTPPTFRSASSEVLAWAQAGYRDALCDLIGSVVHCIEVQPDAVCLKFEGGSAVCVSLRDDDYRGPEALQFLTEAGQTWVA